MQPISDEQLHNLVEKIVRQTVGAMVNPVPVPAPAVVDSPKPIQSETAPQPSSQPPAGKKVVAIGTDHGGVDLKQVLKADLVELGYEVIDCGTNSPDSVDYPDFAQKVSEAVLNGQADLGILVCGTGIGIGIAANRNRGIRAATCTSPEMARLAREHNDANILCVGRRILTLPQCVELIDVFLKTPFSGQPRHQHRIDKMS